MSDRAANVAQERHWLSFLRGRLSIQYLARLVDLEIERRVRAFPAVLVVGPRACGKTTSAARIAGSVTRLDQPGTAAAFRADPDSALTIRDEPALLDE